MLCFEIRVLFSFDAIPSSSQWNVIAKLKQLLFYEMSLSGPDMALCSQTCFCESWSPGLSLLFGDNSEMSAVSLTGLLRWDCEET